MDKSRAFDKYMKILQFSVYFTPWGDAELSLQNTDPKKKVI